MTNRTNVEYAGAEPMCGVYVKTESVLSNTLYLITELLRLIKANNSL